MSPAPDPESQDRHRSAAGPLGVSRPVASNQDGLHPRLVEIVRRHAKTRWRQPLHPPTERCFAQLVDLVNAAGRDRPLVLDAGCGNGTSTRRLAEQHPDAMVLGLDQSAARLARVGADAAPQRDGRVVWARVELATFWRLALEAGWRVDHHYLLYPNPWPKSAHLARRWHGHPVFPVLLQLGGVLELRSNWEIYAREFSLALATLGVDAPEPERFAPGAGRALTPFEAKYHASGHSLWRVRGIKLT